MNKPVYEIPMDDGAGLPYVAPAAPQTHFESARAVQSAGPVHDLGSMPPPTAAAQPAPPVFDAPAAPVFAAPAAPVFEVPAAQPAAPAYEAPPAYAAPAAYEAPAAAFPPPVAPPVAAPAPAPTAAFDYASAPPPVGFAPPTGPPVVAPPAPSFLPRPGAHAIEEAPPAPAAAKPDFVPRDPDNEAPQTGDGQEGSDPDLVAALNSVVLAGASDLHVSEKTPPMVRVDGSLRPVPGLENWDAEKVHAALTSIMSEEQIAQFEDVLELDFAYTLSTTARFRVNIYKQRNAMGAAFRLIPTQIKQLAALGVPASVGDFAKLARGLVLVTGPTGSGKSTTLAALIDLVNSTRSDHIVTVEDPIEFMHKNKKALVNQREVGHDTHSFTNALKHVLRQDPDVILIGELRDLETISVALTAAETGHLVFATLHTQDAPQTIDRVIDVFPPHQQGQVRAQLAATLQGVVCQTLVKHASGKGRVVATEVLVMTPAISNLIREGKTFQIHSALQAGREQGMFTMDQHLAELVDNGKITHEGAMEKAHDIEALMQMIHRANPGTSGRGMANDLDFGDSFSRPAGA